MKLVGHVFIAIKAFPRRNTQFLAFGSLLPETVFYTKNPALTFEQIHEGGLELYKFCKQKHLNFVDLGIGVMAHSVRFGADSYDSDDAIVRLGYVEKDIPKISEALEVDLKTAKTRAHNLYDLALDFYIYEKHPQIKKFIEETKRIDKEKIADILSECYSSSKPLIKSNLSHLWDKYDLSLMETFKGLAKFWRILAKDLPETDPVNIPKTEKLLKSFYKKVKPRAEGFIQEVIKTTRAKINEAIL